MKRFIGWVLVLLGLVGTLWGGFSLLTGSSHARVFLTPDVAVTSVTGGLVGVVVLTLGLIWVRD